MPKNKVTTTYLSPGTPAAHMLVECATSLRYRNVKGEVSWSLIMSDYPEFFEGFTIQQISQKFNRVLNPMLVKGPFSSEEIEMVKLGMERYKCSPSKISKHIFEGTRSDVQIHPYIKRLKNETGETKCKKQTKRKKNGVKKQQKTKKQLKKKKSSTTTKRKNIKKETREEEEEEEEAQVETDEESEADFFEKVFMKDAPMDEPETRKSVHSMLTSPPLELIASQACPAPPSSKRAAPEPSIQQPAKPSSSMMSPPKQIVLSSPILQRTESLPSPSSKRDVQKKTDLQRKSRESQIEAFITQRFLYTRTLSPLVEQKLSWNFDSHSSHVNVSDMDSYFQGKMNELEKEKQITITSPPPQRPPSTPVSTSSSSSRTADTFMSSPPSQGLYDYQMLATEL